MTWVFLLFLGFFGLACGSFLNVVLARTRTGESIIWPSSHCVECNQAIAWYDNLPLLSYVLLRGRCRRCTKPIHWQYPVVEATTAVAWVMGGAVVGAQWRLAWVLAVITLLVLVFFYDLRYYEIPDRFTIPLAVIGVLGSFLIDGRTLVSLGIGIGLGAGFFALQFIVSRGRWIGSGDIRLGAAMGCVLGWPLVGVALALAYISGAAIGLGLIGAGKKHLSSRVQFGTFLSLATIVTLLWGDTVLHWYLLWLLQ